jgi:multiple sugar transport system permease protein
MPRNAERRERAWAVIVGLAPTALVALVFVVVPLAISAYVSLWDWPLLRPGRTFIGLGNYARLLQSPDFWQALGVTVAYALGTVGLGLPLALGLALLLNAVGRGRNFYRTSLFLPTVVAAAIAAIFWRWFYQPYTGPLGALLRLVGLPPVAWLDDPQWALPALVLMTVWKQTGYFVIVFLAGLRSIPPEINEAARLDGAGWLAEQWHVSRPLLRPATTFVLITGTILAVESFGAIYGLTGGGPAGATTTLVVFLYERAFAFSELGYASALGWAMFALLFPLIWLQFRRWGREGLEA